MAKRSRAEQDIERRIDAFSDDPERVEVLSRASRFKRSWMELAEALTEVRSQSAFLRWEFGNFGEYCARELHLRKATADKLTASYGYLSEYAPQMLTRDGVTEPIPQPDTIHALARAREKEQVPGRIFDSIQAEAFAGDLAPATLARRFKEVVDEEPAPKEQEGRQIKRAVGLARRLADLLAELRQLPDTLAADVEEQLGRLIRYLDKRGDPRRSSG